MTRTNVQVNIRWMVRRDMVDVLRIEQASYMQPWDESEYLDCLRQRDHIGMVAEYKGRIVGAMVYQLCKRKIVLVNLAVDPEHRLRGVGSQMIQKLIGKLSTPYRPKMQTGVHETNLGAQLFLRSLGFQAIAISEEEEDGDRHYLFTFRHGHRTYCRDHSDSHKEQ